MVKRSTFSGSRPGVEADGGAQLNVDNSMIGGNNLGGQGGGNIRLSNAEIAFNTTAITGATISWRNNGISGPAPSPAGGASSAFGQQ